MHQLGGSAAVDPRVKKPAAPRYDVVALRVAFQPDTSRFTTGDGTFEGALFDTLEALVDPLPHDAAYFEAHLQFLSNYVEQVSNGRTVVTTHLVPEVVQLSEVMGAYSPTGPEADSDEELRKLAGLVDEAWAQADAEATFDFAGFDPATTAFVIFHAGVGRDIELVGTTLDKTPEDLPTIFFDEASLQRLLGASLSFKGFPVSHTLLMPRTETRKGFDFIQDEPFLVEFSINGLLASSFFNFLGVPDLFDTETGESAIGPFGLMDPLGLFAYNGLFPPEPSAWTKQFLGWTEPVIVDGSTPLTVEINAASGRSEREMARVPVSSAEYFLVENRYRDLANDGLVLTVYRNGALVEQRIENGDEAFNSVTIDGFEGGVVVDVDDFDWALPGGIDDEDNDLLGGALVWHIDENVLVEGIERNRVNVVPTRRAVDLEEADGAQDLGFPSGNIFAPQSHLGTPFDFYYQGNPVLVITASGEEVSLYENRFGPETIPNSDTNNGGASFVVLEDFTLPGPAMSFSYRRPEGAGLNVVDGFPSAEGLEVAPGGYVGASIDPEDGVYFLRNARELVVARRGAPDVAVLRSGGFGSPITLPDDRVWIVEIDEAGDVFLAQIRGAEVLRVPLGIRVNPERGPSDVFQLLYEPSTGLTYALVRTATFGGLFEIEERSGITSVTRIDLLSDSVFSMAAAANGQVAVLTDQGVVETDGRVAWPLGLGNLEGAGPIVLGEDRTGTVGAFARSPVEIVFLEANGASRTFDLTGFLQEAPPEGASPAPVLVDLDGDDLLDVLVSAGDRLVAVSRTGALLPGFPIAMPAAGTTQPLVASTGESGLFTLFVGAEDGNIHAFDLGAGGRQAPGFPLAVGFGVPITPLLDGGRLYAVSSSGKLNVWELAGLSDIWWSQQGGNRFNTRFVQLVSIAPPVESDGLFVEGEVYNWPNPIRNGQTFFRITPAVDVDIEIAIIDNAGERVDTIRPGPLPAQVPTDIEWTTDASSGLYYARVEATDARGRSETTLVKLAVIR